MQIEIYVQARMGSTRLPGKVMLRVLDKPLLGFLLDRLKEVKECDAIVVLTTTEAIDDAIEDFCYTNKVACYRGPEEDVLARYYQAAVLRSPDAIVRVTADCPLIDPEVIDLVIRTYKTNFPNHDYISNSLERSYPRGLDAEIFSFRVLDEAYHKAKADFEREHVTPYLYRHPELYHLKNVKSAEMLSHHRWTVDTKEDFLLVKLILEHLYPSNPHFRTKDVLELLQRHPDWININAHVKQKNLS